MASALPNGLLDTAGLALFLGPWLGYSIGKCTDWICNIVLEQGGSCIWSLTDTCRVFPSVSRDYLILKRPSRGLTFQKVSECFVTSIRGFTTLRRSVQARWWILLCQCVLRLPFVVSVPLKLWCGHGGGVTLQCAHAAHLSLWALGLLYCRRICGVT